MSSGFSATPIANSYIKSSTLPCDLHRETLAVVWIIMKSYYKHFMVILNVLPCRIFVSAKILKFKPLEEQKFSHKAVDHIHRLEKYVACKNCVYKKKNKKKLILKDLFIRNFMAKQLHTSPRLLCTPTRKHSADSKV